MTIRTPDDENPDWLYLPFTPGWWYQGATYPGHSPYSTDWNRRTKTGAWVNDEGDPVLAPQDGTVAEVDRSEGLVMLHHHRGLTQVELRHMQNINVQPGDKVKRGDRVGRVGNVAGSGRSFGPHLHMVQYGRKTTKEPFRRVPLTIEGKRIPVSIGDSDTKPETWKPPSPVLLQGPPARATWESAYRDAAKALGKAEDREAELSVKLGAMAEELRTAKARIAELEARPPADCAAIALERDGALERAALEADRAIAAETRVREAVAVLTR